MDVVVTLININLFETHSVKKQTTVSSKNSFLKRMKPTRKPIYNLQLVKIKVLLIVKSALRIEYYFSYSVLFSIVSII